MMIAKTRKVLKKHSDPAERKKRVYWEKMDYEKPRLYGVPTPLVRKFSSSFFGEIRRKPKEEILQNVRRSARLRLY